MKFSFVYRTDTELLSIYWSFSVVGRVLYYAEIDNLKLQLRRQRKLQYPSNNHMHSKIPSSLSYVWQTTH